MLPPEGVEPPSPLRVEVPVPVLFADGSVALDAVRVAKRKPGEGTERLAIAYCMSCWLSLSSDGLNQ